MLHRLLVMLVFIGVSLRVAAAGFSSSTTDSSTATVTSPSLEIREYCEWETFNASCSSSSSSSGGGGDTKGDVIATHEDHVIVIRNARYGRMHVGRCVTQSYGNIGCGADVTAELSRACSGRVRCSVSVISLYSRRSCPKDFTSYLEASYECIRVTASATDDVCGRNDATGLPLPTVLLTSSTGLLASRLSPTACPWTIRVEPFQQIVVSMTDFDVIPAGETSTAVKPANGIGGVQMHDCIEYAVIADVITSSATIEDSSVTSSSSNMSLCGGDNVYRGRRDEVVFRSRGHIIQIYIRLIKSFLLSYEAVGCPDVLTPPNAWTRRTGSQHAVVQCNSSTEAWFLTCRGTSWIGTIGNCSTMYQHSSGGSESDWPSFGAVQRFPIGVLIVVAFGVAIGVVIGVLLLVSVLTCMRHRVQMILETLYKFARSTDAIQVTRRRRRACKVQLQSRSNCSNISSSYATVVGYYGDIDKNVVTPGYELPTDSSVLAESALRQQSIAPDHTATSSVAMATVTEHCHRTNEGVTNLSADDLLKSIEQQSNASSRKSRSSCSLVSMFPPSSDCFGPSTRAHQGPRIPFVAVRPHVRQQPSQLFIMSDGTRVELGQTSSEKLDPNDAIGVPISNGLPSARWTLKAERRRRPTTTNEPSAHHQRALTPGNSYRHKPPLTDKTPNRGRKCGVPDEIPPIWNTVRSCPQEYDVLFRPHASSTAATHASENADRDPDVVQNCAICRHASSVGTFQMSADDANVRLYHNNTDRF